MAADNADDKTDEHANRLRKIGYLPGADVIFDPAWRWRAAVRLQRVARLRSQCDDRTILEAVRFLRAWEDAGDDMAMLQRVARRTPELAGAWRLWVSDDHPARWYLEALVTAAEDPGAIAQFLGVERRTVDTYEALFFDIRPHLEAPGFVLSNVLRRRVGASPAAVYDYVWKAVAYFGGTALLYDYWSLSPEQASEVSVFVTDMIAKAMADAALELSVTYDREKSGELPELPLRRWLTLQELEVKRAELRSSATAVEEKRATQVIETLAKEFSVVRKRDVAVGRLSKDAAEPQPASAAMAKVLQDKQVKKFIDSL